MASHLRLRHGEVLVKGDAVKARHVANQLALQAAVAIHPCEPRFLRAHCGA